MTVKRSQGPGGRQKKRGGCLAAPGSLEARGVEVVNRLTSLPTGDGGEWRSAPRKQESRGGGQRGKRQESDSEAANKYLREK